MICSASMSLVVEEKEQLEVLDFTIDPRGNWSLHMPRQ